MQSAPAQDTLALPASPRTWLAAAALSLLFHAWVLSQLPALPASAPGLGESVELRASYSRPRPATSTLPTVNAPREAVVRAPRRDRQALPAERMTVPDLPAPAVARPLQLSPDTLREIAREFNAGQSQAPAALPSGAVVLDSALVEQLNRRRRTANVVELGEQHADAGRFAAGTWSDFVEFDGMCFRVMRSDPLDPLSREAWYRERCPR